MGPPARRHRVHRYVAVVVGFVVVATAGSLYLVVPSIARPTRAKSSDQSTALDPSLFTAGSCESFPPTQGDRHLTVFLDAGHGGLDPGAVGTTESGEVVHEADETLPVELDATTLLRADGFRVVVSRTRASTVVRPEPGDVSGGLFTVQGEHRDVAARDVCANLGAADVLVGIYFDAGASQQDAGSITGYDADRPFSTSNLRLADLVESDVVASMNAQGWQIPDEGVVPDSTLGGPALSSPAATYGHLLLLGPAMAGYFSTPSEMPGALIEPLFITDPFEASLAASADGQHVIAHGIARALEQYFGASAAIDAAPTTPHPG